MQSNRVLAHELDAAWIIALYKYIHGGDPGPDQLIASNVVAAMAPVLAGEAVASTSVEMLQRRFGEIGSQISIEPVKEPEGATRHTEALTAGGVGWHFVEVCFGIPPNRHCVLVQLPRTHA